MTMKEISAINGLKRKGITITPGRNYVPASFVPRKTGSLMDIRRRLSKIKKSLSQTVTNIRQEK